jgi:hypothetical protein
VYKDFSPLLFIEIKMGDAGIIANFYISFPALPNQQSHIRKHKTGIANRQPSKNKIQQKPPHKQTDFLPLAKKSIIIFMMGVTIT